MNEDNRPPKPTESLSYPFFWAWCSWTNSWRKGRIYY